MAGERDFDFDADDDNEDFDDDELELDFEDALSVSRSSKRKQKKRHLKKSNYVEPWDDDWYDPEDDLSFGIDHDEDESD